MELKCTNEKQADVLAAVIGERSHQDRKWGTVEQRPKQVGSYLTLMRKLLNDAEIAWATSDNDQGALDELRKVVAVGVACFEQHGVPWRMGSQEPAQAVLTVATSFTFEEFIQHGRDNGANIVNGMPWSWTFHGRAVSHENDQCYLIAVLSGGESMRFTPHDVLVVGDNGFIFLKQDPGKPTPLAAYALDELRAARDRLIQNGRRFIELGTADRHVVDMGTLNREFLARGLAGECGVSPLQPRTNSA